MAGRCGRRALLASGSSGSSARRCHLASLTFRRRLPDRSFSGCIPRAPVARAARSRELSTERLTLARRSLRQAIDSGPSTGWWSRSRPASWTERSISRPAGRWRASTRSSSGRGTGRLDDRHIRDLLVVDAGPTARSGGAGRIRGTTGGTPRRTSGTLSPGPLVRRPLVRGGSRHGSSRRARSRGNTPRQNR